jgi:hypothetical protein
MSVIQTVLVFIGIPLAVVLLIVIAVYGRSIAHQPNRYRPGRPWNYPPAWYKPHPDAIEDVVSDRPAVEGDTSHPVAVGGASGEW